MNLLAFDPGVDNPAFALFRDSVAVMAARIRLPELKDCDPVDRAQRVVSHAMVAIHRAAGPNLMLDALVMERPQFYRASKSKGDPNKLALLTLVCGSLATAVRYEAGDHVVVRSYLPAQWAGQIPKSTKAKEAWKSPRGRLVRGQLTSEELAVVESNHDSVDAVGIGLHFLGRLRPPSVYPGAR